MYKILMFLIFFNVSFLEAINDKVNNDFIENNVIDKESFSKFLKKSSVKKRFFCDRYVVYFNNRSFYIYDLKTNKETIIDVNLNKKEKVSCFGYDGENIYFVVLKELRKIDTKGIVILKQDLKDFVCKEITSYDGVLYLFSYNNEIYALDNDLNCLWFQNDFGSLVNLFETSYKFIGRKLIIFCKNRLCIIDALNGKIIKNVYSTFSYDRFTIKDNKIFLYANLMYKTVDLDTYESEEFNYFSINNTNYKININNKIMIDNKEEEFVYICHRFLNNEFIAYKNDDYSSFVFHVSKNGLKKYRFNRFILKDIFVFDGKLILIDEKFGKFEII